MDEKKLADAIDLHFMFSILLIVAALLSMANSNIDKNKKELADKIDYKRVVPKIEIAKPAMVEKIEPTAGMIGYYDLKSQWTNVYIGYYLIDYKYIGHGYITAYCAEECGWSYSTSSGATCHYSDDWDTPTTCAIDRKYFNYGDLFYIDGKIYVAEDTGSAVKGMHFDLYRESMDEVRNFGSHYTEVYSVRYINRWLNPNDIHFIDECRKEYWISSAKKT